MNESFAIEHIIVFDSSNEHGFYPHRIFNGGAG